MPRHSKIESEEVQICISTNIGEKKSQNPFFRIFEMIN